ncbi:MAG: hypothetical protein IT369_23520 [Candidatus Latescibacteria bacterium]|nr:hypothetical protein [Candidatus Latescibacterota bacterium]
MSGWPTGWPQCGPTTPVPPAAKMSARRRWNSFTLALLVSLLVHVLALLVIESLPTPVQEIRYAVRLSPAPQERWFFEPVPPSSFLPGGDEMEWLRGGAQPQAWKGDPMAGLTLPEIGAAAWCARPLEEERWQGAPPHFGLPPDTALSLEALDLAMMKQHQEELAQYEGLWLPDVDTSDAETHSRSRAQQIVEAAVEAMGGTRALAQIKDMTLTPVRKVDFQTLERMEEQATQAEVQDQLLLGQVFFKASGIGAKYAQYLPGGGRLVYDGKHAWMSIAGSSHELKGEELKVIRNRAERWDFLSRYLGEGIQLACLEAQKDPTGRSYHVIQVEDLKFGGVSFRALFDQETHLLVGEEFPADFPALQKRFLDYKKVGGAFLWSQIESTTSGPWSIRRDTLAVRYQHLADEVFALAGQEEKWEGLTTHEYGATLWVDARFGNQPYEGRPVIARENLGLVSERVAYPRRASPDTAKHYLTYEQKRMVEAQIRQITAEEMKKRGLFARVAVFGGGEVLSPRDYLLQVQLLRKKAPTETKGRVFFGAELHRGAANELLMRDGPIPDYYFGVAWGGDVEDDVATLYYNEATLNLPCRVYRLPVFTVEDRIAYVSEERVRELLYRTYNKVAQTLNARQSGQPLPFTNPCCYCQGP